MDRKEFFEKQFSTPSVLSLVVDAALADFSNAYVAKANGTFSVETNGQVSCVLSEDETASDIRAWVRELQSDGGIQDKIVALVRSNPGWEVIIAKRVIRELRKWAT